MASTWSRMRCCSSSGKVGNVGIVAPASCEKAMGARCPGEVWPENLDRSRIFQEVEGPPLLARPLQR